MRESNFCNPAQNKASVCISSAVYDRRAIDCTATLPLINSLNHLAYLTSTSPRIREMVTLDGGLERLIRILRTVPKTPSPQVRTFSIKEMQAVWKWSLAFQCVVNIGVRGSESVRTRVVEAGMVPVTIHVLESYLRSMDRLKEERRKEALLHHQRHEARREDRSHRDRTDPVSNSLAQLDAVDGERARRHHAPHDAHAQAPADGHESSYAPADPQSDSAHRGVTLSTDQSTNAQLPPIASVHANTHDRLLAETRPTTPLEVPVSTRRTSVFAGMEAQSSADVYLPAQTSPIPVVDATQAHAALPMIDAIDPLSLASSGSAPSVAPDGTPRALSTAQSQAHVLGVGSSSEDLPSHNAEASGSGSDGAEDAEMFADDADDSEVDAVQSFAAQSTDSDPMQTNTLNQMSADDDLEERRTPRPARRALAPLSAGQDPPSHSSQSFITPDRPTHATAPPLFERQDTVRPSRDFASASGSRDVGSTNTASTALAAQVGLQDMTRSRSSLFDHQQSHTEQQSVQAQPEAPQQTTLHDNYHHHNHQQHNHHHHHHDQRRQQRVDGTQQQSAHMARQNIGHHQHATPRDPPRTAAPRAMQPPADATAAHPPVVQLNNLADTNARAGIDVVYREEEVLLSLQLLAYLSKYAHVRILFHSSDFTGASLTGPLDVLNEELEQATKRNKSWDPSEPPRSNVFSIAEKFTLRSSRSNSAAYPAPRLSMEIQYWAGVIMRNACRKDESRGGIRQCANMLCGKWEEYPREFAKCRRCRKAKYCSKQCQSKGWQMGHRYWCSAKADDGDAKDKEREKANDPHRAGRPEDGDGAGPHIVPMTTHDTGHAGFAARLPNEEGDGLRDAIAPRLPRAGQINLDDMNDNAADRRRWQGGEDDEPNGPRDGRVRARSVARPNMDLSASDLANVSAAAFDTPQHRAAFARIGASSDDLTANGSRAGVHGHAGSQTGSSSEMQRLAASASSSVDMLVDPRHAVSASEDEEAWTGGAGGSGASRHEVASAPHTNASSSAAPESSSRWYGGVADGDVGAFASSASSSALGSNLDSPAQTSRGARRGVVPGSMGLPSTMLRQDLRDRRVTSLASLDTVDGSDVSEDETERRLAQTQGILPAFAAAAAAAGLRAREGEVPPQAPQRTDLAGRPLPPPVIASQNGEEDELALGGRATPGVAGEQDFATGEIDQMLGHWATRRPGSMGMQHRLAEVRPELPSPGRSMSPVAGAAHGAEASEATMGARSDDEDLGATSRAARYAGLYGQPAYHGGIVRGQTPQPHHRLHQPRSASGFSQFGAHGSRFGYGESMGEPSNLQGYRTASMVSSPLAQTPVRRASGHNIHEASTNVVSNLEQAAQSLRHVDQHRPSSSTGAGHAYDEDVAMSNDAASVQGAASSSHSRFASSEDEVLEDTDDRDDISMDL